jgi:hypothetical protein
MSKRRLKLCAHSAVDGSTCKAPAMRMSNYCRHHRRVNRPPVLFPDWVTEATSLSQIQLALARTMAGLWDGTIPNKFGGQILNQIAMRVKAFKRASAAVAKLDAGRQPTFPPSPS